jgi:hypothetical protein
MMKDDAIDENFGASPYPPSSLAVALDDDLAALLASSWG